MFLIDVSKFRRHGRIQEVTVRIQLQILQTDSRSERGCGEAGDPKTLSTSSRVGVARTPDATSVVLAKPQLKLQGASEEMHVEARAGCKRAPVVRAVKLSWVKGAAFITVSRLRVPNQIEHLLSGKLWG